MQTPLKKVCKFIH